MNKMYFENNNAGCGILVTDGKDWFWIDKANGLSVNLRGESDAENVEIIRQAIANGELFGADDMVDEFSNYEDVRERYIVPEYHGMSLNDIDNLVNYETNSFGDRVPVTEGRFWTEI